MKLLQPVTINQWDLQSRVVMAPMTRGFADQETGIIHQDTIHYYAIRAKFGVGLIITEGIAISPEARGTIGIPGLYRPEHIEAWKRVTEQVHAENGRIIAQLWHVGRLSHSSITGGVQPIAPSAVQANGVTHKVHLPYEMPKAMTKDDINKVIQNFKTAARNAHLAGFDGIEIHAAHGYLIDQFQFPWVNFRKDRYGQEKYLFLQEILHAVCEAIEPERVIVRFSEHKDDSPLFYWESPEQEIIEILNVIQSIGISIIHPSAKQYKKTLHRHELTLHALVRKYRKGVQIGVGELTPDLAEELLRNEEIQLAAFGRPLLSNADFVKRVKEGRELKKYNAQIDLPYLH